MGGEVAKGLEGVDSRSEGVATHCTGSEKTASVSLHHDEPQQHRKVASEIMTSDWPGGNRRHRPRSPRRNRGGGNVLSCSDSGSNRWLLLRWSTQSPTRSITLCNNYTHSARLILPFSHTSHTDGLVLLSSNQQSRITALIFLFSPRLLLQDRRNYLQQPSGRHFHLRIPLRSLTSRILRIPLLLSTATALAVYHPLAFSFHLFSSITTMSTSFRALLPEGGSTDGGMAMLGGGDGPKTFQQEYDAYCKMSKKNVSQTTDTHCCTLYSACTTWTVEHGTCSTARRTAKQIDRQTDS